MRSKGLDEAEVRKLVDDWYHALDVHVPFEEIVPLVASSGLEMYWPEGPTFGVDEFKGWYDRVTRTFFDEVHTMKELVITPRGDTLLEAFDEVLAIVRTAQREALAALLGRPSA